ncbi:NUDIX hydrolase [Kribbella flavida DSM 17836]|uniref:NUDIX hydrolase n=1 Tax=Kribbella flavida (strain DSM 17836 / JCM 10339 / NBRC 14399) TaxID=479435 RepID=D2Q4H6_KRIFD|nr:NUDIX hydrolase [Kribbella flavida]ADB32290.1 NUDIX hydrolase [Kribbella flavida DSM 17836]
MTSHDSASSAAGTSPAADRVGDPQPWELLAEKTVYDGFLTVNLRRYRLPDGREADWDVFGPQQSSGVAGGITVLPLTPDGRVLTIRLFRAGPDRVVTNLPGGIIDPGEDPAAAGQRELEEETGYTCGSIEVVGWFWSAASSTYRKYVAIARDCRPDGRQSLDEFEDCVPVELTLADFRAELRTPGAMTGTDAAYLALDHAGLL